MALVKKGMPIWFDFGMENMDVGVVEKLVWRRKNISMAGYKKLKPGLKRKYKLSKDKTYYYTTYPFTIVSIVNFKHKYAIPYWVYSTNQNGLLYEGSLSDLLRDDDPQYEILMNKEKGAKNG